MAHGDIVGGFVEFVAESMPPCEGVVKNEFDRYSPISYGYFERQQNQAK
jgi:hypothetical protein